MKINAKRIIFCSILLTWLIYGDIQFYHAMTIKTVRCGTVVEDFTNIKNVKYGTSTSYYLVVQYPNERKAERVEGETFYEKRIGDSICFRERNTIPAQGLITCAISVTLLVIPLCIGLYYLLDYIFD